MFPHSKFYCEIKRGFSQIHFSEKTWNLSFVDLFLKCGNYCMQTTILR
ncbi:hypothetical protein LEP1GSC049_3413 [Leptospira kirschneri serovar Cynopteri str. 3522 CT]|nr:hypothetical protein LEP1GSC049_3413 [Leptospira kirschneri serovar Cynopteri str. 3522 CT]